MPEDPNKYAEFANSFIQAALITQILVVVGLAFIFGIIVLFALRRTSNANTKMGDSISESVATLIATSNDYKKQRDEAVALVKTGEIKLQADSEEHKAKQDAFTEVMRSFASTEAKKLEFDRQRTEAWVDAAKSLDVMRSDNEKALVEERTNIITITKKIDDLSSQTVSLLNASNGLPDAVAAIIKPELSDVKLLVERLGSFLEAIDATKLEFGQKLDQAKGEVIQSVMSLQQHLNTIASHVSSETSDPLTIPMQIGGGALPEGGPANG